MARSSLPSCLTERMMAWTTFPSRIGVSSRRAMSPSETSSVERFATRGDRSVELEHESSVDDELSDDEPMTDVRHLATQPPVARYLNLLVRDAHDASASDVHLEATRSGLSARLLGNSSRLTRHVGRRQHQVRRRGKSHLCTHACRPTGSRSYTMCSGG
jgi:hypothetical protein